MRIFNMRSEGDGYVTIQDDSMRHAETDVHCEPKKTKMILIYSLHNLTDCDEIWYILF